MKTTINSISTRRFLELSKQMNYIEAGDFTSDFPGMPAGRVLFQLNREPKLLLAIAGGKVFWMQDHGPRQGTNTPRLVGTDLADWSADELRWAAMGHEGVSLLRQAGREHSRAKYKAAAKKFAALHEAFPNDCMALLYLGLAFARCGREQKALDVIKRALSMAGGDLAVLHSGATTFDSLGWLAEAADVYRQILAREPEHREALARLPVMLMAQGKIKEVEPVIRKAIQLIPDNTDLHCVYADFAAHLAKGGRIADAQKILQKLDVLTSNNGVVEVLRATLLEADGKWEEARAASQRADSLLLDNLAKA